MDNLIVAQEKGDVFEIILNRPEKRNAISLALWQELDAALKRVAQLSRARVLVIRGEGPSFCVGADISAFARLQETYGSDWMHKGRLIAHDMQSVLNRLQRLEIPTLALVHGHCLGMGFELALACDFRLAETGARFGLPETLLGLVPDVGGTTRLTKLVGPTKAKELIFTGRQISADEAQAYGIVSQVATGSDLPEMLDNWVRNLSKAAPAAVGMAKRIIDSIDGGNHGFDLEGWAQTQLYSGAEFQKAMQMHSERHKS